MVTGAPPSCAVKLTLRTLTATFAQSLEALDDSISGTGAWTCDAAAGALAALEPAVPAAAAVLVADDALVAGTLLPVPDPDPPQPAMPAASKPITATRTARITVSPQAELPLSKRQLAPSIERARRLGCCSLRGKWSSLGGCLPVRASRYPFQELPGLRFMSKVDWPWRTGEWLEAHEDRAHMDSAHRKLFRTADGWIAVLPYTAGQWCRFLGKL
jgi:hypothetical protein